MFTTAGKLGKGVKSWGSSLYCFAFCSVIFPLFSPSLEPSMALITELHNEDRQQNSQRISVLWPEDWENGSPWAQENSREVSFFPVLFLSKSRPYIKVPWMWNSTVTPQGAKTESGLFLSKRIRKKKKGLVVWKVSMWYMRNSWLFVC